LTMEPERWERIQALFHQAVAQSEQERRSFLEAECAGDPGLLEEVEALLEEDRLESLLDRRLPTVAGRLMGEPPHAVGAGASFGSYRVLDVIGRGGMGVVYLAERPDLGHRVAIKVLQDASLSPARRRRFAREQRALAQLNHPSIAQLYDADVLPDGTPWFAMEYVEGIPLTEYCRQRRISLNDRLHLLRAVCEAVQHAHRHLIVHRDLKPSNILVRDDGAVKLLDFGIAKELESPGMSVDQTRTGLRLMTPAYAAPERLRGDRVGIHTDVYALGVLLYELLTGRLPFDLTGCTPAEAERIILHDRPLKPSWAVMRTADPGGVAFTATGRRAWADLDVLCLSAMHGDPQRRYPTVDALLREIDHYFAGEPLEARPDTLGYRAGKFVHRNRRALSAAGVVLAFVLGLVGFYTARLATARDAALSEAARTQRIQHFMLDLFRGGEGEVGPADSLRVATLLDRGVMEAGALEQEPEVQAELLHTLGGLHQELGRLERADSLLQVALDRRRALHGPDHPDVARTEVAIGDLRLDQARLEEAERWVRRGLEGLETRLPADHAFVTEAMTVLGRVLQARGEYDPSITVLEKAVRLRERKSGGNDPELAASLRELGNTHFYAGHFPEADSIFRRVLALDRQLHGDRHPLVASDLVNVGAVLHEWGRYEEAERRYREALERTRGFYGNDHPRTAENLTMLSRSLIFQQKLEEAEEELGKALGIQERLLGPDHPLVASTVNELGSVALLGDRLDEAEEAYARVVRIYREVHDGDHFVIGVAVSNLASVSLRRERFRRAETLFREAVRLFSETQAPDHLNTGIARIKLGRALLRQRRFEDAARESLAGYEIVASQSDPGVSWLQSARADLVAAFDSLGRPERADRFRAELAEPAAGLQGPE